MSLCTEICRKCLNDPERRAEVEYLWDDPPTCLDDDVIPCPVCYEVLEAGPDSPPNDCPFYLEHFLVVESTK